MLTTGRVTEGYRVGRHRVAGTHLARERRMWALVLAVSIVAGFLLGATLDPGGTTRVSTVTVTAPYRAPLSRPTDRHPATGAGSPHSSAPRQPAHRLTGVWTSNSSSTPAPVE
jgi:hypothetical protein